MANNLQNKIFESFCGTWCFWRDIPGQGRIDDGVAVFRFISPGLLHYREDGIFRLENGHISQSYREYLYALENEKIVLRFKDGTFFHGLNFFLTREGISAASGEHPCGADHYAALFQFHGTARFDMRYTVKGPRKDYISDTFYRR